MLQNLASLTTEVNLNRKDIEGFAIRMDLFNKNVPIRVTNDVKEKILPIQTKFLSELENIHQKFSSQSQTTLR